MKLNTKIRNNYKKLYTKKPFKNWFTFNQTLNYMARRSKNRMEWNILVTKPWKVKRAEIKVDKSKFLSDLIHSTYNYEEETHFMKPNKPQNYLLVKPFHKNKLNTNISNKLNNILTINKSYNSIENNIKLNNKTNELKLFLHNLDYNKQLTLKSNNILTLLKFYSFK